MGAVGHGFIALCNGIPKIDSKKIQEIDSLIYFTDATYKITPVCI